VKLEPTPLSVLGFPRYFRSSRQGCSIQPASSLSYQWNRHFRRILAFIRKIAVAVSVVMFMLSLAAVAAGAGLDGRWEGKIDRSGKAQSISVDLAQDDNGWQGSIDIPDEAIVGRPLQRIIFERGGVQFETQVMGVKLSFEGKREGDKITGTFSQGGDRYPFFLERKSAASSLGRSSSPAVSGFTRNQPAAIGNEQAGTRGQMRVITQDEESHLPEEVEVTRKGRDFAILFAGDDYDSWGHLNNPIFDAKSIKEELEGTYGFQTELFSNPTRAQIWDVIRRYRDRKYDDEDQLLIFFAGHGIYSDSDQDGFFVAKDTKKEEADPDRDTFVPYYLLKNRIDSIPVKHVLLVLDACFSGAFDPKVGEWESRGDPPKNVSDRKLVKRMMRLPTRRYLTSGGKQYVSDGKPGHHSPFANGFLNALRGYGDDHRVLSYYNIVDGVRRKMVDEKAQPRHGDFGKNDSGSDFFFIVNLPSPASPKN
jgi:hypothetical protein